MKPIISHLATELLTPEENAMLMKHRLMDQEPSKPLGIEVRAGMCEALAELSESVRAMLALMGRYDLPAVMSKDAFTTYTDIMDRIGVAASKASNMVEQSRNLDQQAMLAVMRGETDIIQ